MRRANRSVQSGAFTATAVSVASLVVVWGLVWASLPSKEAMLSDAAPARPAAPPELDLTIPGLVPASPREGGARDDGRPSEHVVPAGTGQAKQIAEIRCEAEIQRVCPDGLPADRYRQCVERHVTQASPGCEETIRRRLVRWKAASSYQTACREDAVRYCREMRKGDERLMQCLQEHAQSVSDRCYQSLPKGTLHYNR